MAHKPSKYQQAIYDTFQKTDKNMVISAVAGSGKTTTIVNLTELIKPGLFATQEWEHEQESNLDYVARTRAKKLLVYVEDFCSDAEKMKALKASIAEFKSN